MKDFFTPNEFRLGSDSKCIQAAVAAAHDAGCGKVVIPAYNERTGAYLWSIDETIRLPSHTYLLIDNAHLRMADGSICRMFENSNAVQEIGKTAEGLQEDIIIQGQGRALLDGGLHNDIRERNPNRDKLPRVTNNLTIYFHNVCNFKVDGLTIRDQRWWSMAFMYAWEGVISNLRFEITLKSHRQSLESPWKNQDGIDLRIGCHNIQIFNISGETCDDVIALTALGSPENPGGFEMRNYCPHLNGDIFNVTIRNVVAFNNHCSMVRLLCHYGHRIYNIDIDHLVDATPEGDEYDVEKCIRTANCVKLGENNYHKNNPAWRARHGDLHDITISNVFSSALAAVVANCTAKNVTIRNVHVGKMGVHALAVSQIYAGVLSAVDNEENVTTLENIRMDGISYHSGHKGATPFFFAGLKAKNVTVENLSLPKGTELITEVRPQAGSEPVRMEKVVYEA